MPEPLSVAFTPTDLARAAGISVPYASQVMSGARPLHRGLALKIWQAFGVKIGPIADATDAEIDVLLRFEVAA